MIRYLNTLKMLLRSTLFNSTSNFSRTQRPSLKTRYKLLFLLLLSFSFCFVCLQVSPISSGAKGSSDKRINMSL